MSNPVTTEHLLIKYKQAGLSDERIGSRLGMTAAEVAQMWKTVLERNEQKKCNGYDDLTKQYTLLCHHYQLFGESLKIVAEALSNEATDEQVRDLLAGDHSEIEISLRNLRKHLIILKPFAPKDPAVTLQEHIIKTQAKN
jgi:hypothetical protein